MRVLFSGMMRGVGGAAIAGLVIVSGASVSAERFTSPSYTIDASVMNNFGGQGTSSSYKLVGSGGESIVGDGTGGSYKLGAGYAAQLAQSDEPSLSLSVQPSGLAAYYPFDENTGSAAGDAGSHAHTGALQSDASWYGAGKIGSAVDMGTSGSVTVGDTPDLPSGNEMTVEAWVRQANWSAETAIASHWLYQSSGSWAFQTGIDHNLRIFLATAQNDPGDNYVDAAANTWMTYGSWRHVAFTYDGTQSQASMVKVYIDGAPVSTTVHGTLPTSLQDSNGALSIGSFPGLGRYFNGAIDEVKIYNRALSSDEIQAEYAAQNAGVEAGLSIGKIIAGSSRTTDYEAVVETNLTGYSLALAQNHDLQNASTTIPGVAGTIASPSLWSEATTKGLGFSVAGATLGGSVPGKWNGGDAYAAVPGSATTFYSRTGATGTTRDVVNVRLRADVAAAQASGEYQNTITYTATTTP